ncbi:hypothetical protein CPC08DRAFT_119825 [Agrocybe pediades]|nr:hypothetical protein CPC08DRAFT_119825 [Agrocybe pediades]
MSATTATTTAMSNATLLFHENPAGPPTAPRAPRQFMNGRGRMMGPHPPHHHLQPSYPPHTSLDMALNGPSRFYSPGNRDRERD